MPSSASDRLDRVRSFTPPSPTSAYRVRLAGSDFEVEQAQRLRYRVFNQELGEGLAASHATGADVDAYDAVCDHLLIEKVATDEVIGTYRLQTGRRAAEGIGYYSEQEFDFEPYKPLREETLELGRACIAKEHRNMVVLGLLWKGIAQYARIHQSRYLIGCSSLSSTDANAGQSAYRLLAQHLAPLALRTAPRPAFDCWAGSEERGIQEALGRVEIPRLMKAYLALGAWVCGPPALDQSFGTIDFLTLLDLKRLGPRAMQKFLG